MKPFQLFTVYETIDEWGRRGSYIGTFTTKAAAEVAGKDKGWYGGLGEIREEWFIKTEDGTVYALQNPKPVDVDLVAMKAKEVAKQSALDKLTDEDKKLLNL